MLLRDRVPKRSTELTPKSERGNQNKAALRSGAAEYVRYEIIRRNKAPIFNRRY